MPRTRKPAKASTSAAEKIQDESSAHEESSSLDQEQDPEVFIQPSKAQILPNMFMHYIKGLMMGSTGNDGLYHRFLKWCLKCELAMVPEKRQHKKVIAWTGDFGMDQYVSWNLSRDELMLYSIWEKLEEFCRLQSNEVMARFDLLPSFKQESKSVDEWYNALQNQVALAKYPSESAKTLHRDIFCFS